MIVSLHYRKMAKKPCSMVLPHFTMLTYIMRSAKFQLKEHFDTIDHCVKHACATYDTLISETRKSRAAVQGARKRLLVNLPLCKQVNREVCTSRHTVVMWELETEPCVRNTRLGHGHSISLGEGPSAGTE